MPISRQSLLLDFKNNNEVLFEHDRFSGKFMFLIVLLSFYLIILIFMIRFYSNAFAFNDEGIARQLMGDNIEHQPIQKAHHDTHGDNEHVKGNFELKIPRGTSGKESIPNLVLFLNKDHLWFKLKSKSLHGEKTIIKTDDLQSGNVEKLEQDLKDYIDHGLLEAILRNPKYFNRKENETDEGWLMRLERINGLLSLSHVFLYVDQETPYGILKMTLKKLSDLGFSHISFAVSLEQGRQDDI